MKINKKILELKLRGCRCFPMLGIEENDYIVEQHFEDRIPNKSHWIKTKTIRCLICGKSVDWDEN